MTTVDEARAAALGAWESERRQALDAFEAAIRAEAGTLDAEAKLAALREDVRAAGLSVALDALADLQVEAGHVVNEVIRARIDALVERARAGIQYEAWDRAELIAAVDAVLKPEEGADPLPDDEWDPVFLRLRKARAAIAATPAEEERT